LEISALFRLYVTEKALAKDHHEVNLNKLVKILVKVIPAKAGIQTIEGDWK
jgi:hypothetical protein